MNPVSLVQLWMAIKPFARLRERREARRAAEAQGAIAPPDATISSPVHPQEHVDTVVAVAAGILGASRSKLIWLALAQFVYGLVELYINSGAITATSMEPLVTGLLTAAFRIATNSSLAEKGGA